MSKKVIHTTRKINTGDSLLITKYMDISQRNAKKLINRLWKKYGMPLLVRSATGIMIPEQGIEIIRTGYRSLFLCQLTGSFNGNPSLAQLIEGGCTHFYNELVDEWISLEEAKADTEAYVERNS